MKSRKKGRSSSLSWMDQIESTLQRIQRQESTIARPPDEASAATGQGLADRLLEGIEQTQARDVADKIVTCLCENNTSPSLSQSYFNRLASQPRDDLLEWMPPWMLKAEDACMAGDLSSTSLETLSYIIRAYVQCSCTLETVILESISDAFSRLRLSASRTCMLREFVRLAPNMTLLTPLMASCVLNLSVSTEEKMLFLQSVWRRGWSMIKSNSDDTLQFLLWMTDSLHMFLNGIPNERQEDQIMSMELAYQWLQEIVDMVEEMSRTVDQSRQEEFSGLLSTMFHDILPHFFIPSCRFAMEPIVDPLCQAIASSEVDMSFNRAVWFRLGTMALSTPDKKDVASVLSLLGLLPRPSDGMVCGMLHSLACIFANDDECREEAQLLLTHCAVDSDDEHVESESHGDLTSIVQLFQEGEEDSSLLMFMITSLEHLVPIQVSAMDQSILLLLGCSLLRRRAIKQMLVYSYLRALLQQFPHLGISLLPILFQSIQTACDTNDGAAFLRELDFLCDAIVKDPNCAQEVWNLVGVTMIQPDSPTSVRAVAIRTYPKLCANNKKLYRRVIDTLGTAVQSSEPEIRLAVVATIHDLAREDRIRDVSDVIGWVQTYLSDDNPSVAHYAVLCLHHLVAAQELDFGLVMKVLNKRLCPVGDVDELIALPKSVLEALVLLLGDGENDEQDSDGEDNVPTKASQDLLGVPPQVSSAVSSLIQLANTDALCRTSHSTHGTAADESLSRIQRNICISLSNYSLHSLGLDDEGVRSATADTKKDENDRVQVTDAGVRYMDLMQIASDEITSFLPDYMDSGTGPSLSLMTQKLLSLEEESLGSFLWQKKRGKSTTSKPDRIRAPKSAFSALPKHNQIQELYDEHPSFSTAVASLLYYTGNSVDELFEFASEISEVLQLDPISHAFNLQGWLQAMGRVWFGIVTSTDSSMLQSVTSVMDEVNGWRELLDSADVSYLALASFAMFVPESSSEDTREASHVELSEVVEGIRSEVHQARESHQFQSRDMADLCLGMVAAQAVYSRGNAFVERCIGALQESISDHRGQSSFGASYGLALIAQAAAAVSDVGNATMGSSDSAQQQSWIKRIASIFVLELLSCCEVAVPSFVTLAACLKSGKPSHDLLTWISKETEEPRISEMNGQRATGLFLSFALCVQAIGVVSTDLLLCVYKFIQKLPWGVGKGLAIINAAVPCISAGVLCQEDVETYVTESESLAKGFLAGGDTKRFSDVLYACIGIKTYMHAKETVLDDFNLIKDALGDESLSDEFGSSLVVSATVLISTFPCLANGGPLFHSAADLHPRTSKDIVAVVVELLSDKSKNPELRRCANVSTQSLGLLASIRDHWTVDGRGSILGKDSTMPSTESKAAINNQASLEMLPKPHDKTLLEVVMVNIQRRLELVNTKAQRSVSDLTWLLSCLEPLSLPGEFARSFIEPILTGDIEDLKPACVALLVSQVSGRRRAAFDGRDFVKLVNRIALLSPSSFYTMLGIGSGPIVFISSMHAFLPRLPSDNIEAVLVSLWDICRTQTQLTEGSALCAVAYLESLSRLLETKQEKELARLSPRTYTTIMKVLLQSVMPTFASVGMKSQDMMRCTEKAFLDCLSHLDVSVLEENQFFTLSTTKDQAVNFTKAFCIVGLTSREAFNQEGRSSKELMKVVAWIANQHGSQDKLTMALLRELSFRTAIAAKVESAECRKDIMSLVFEALHVHGPGMCLELLGMLTSTLSSGLECDPESSSIEPFLNAAVQDSALSATMMPKTSQLLLNDLACNMGAFGRSEKLQGLITNSIERIVKTWYDQGMKQQDLSSLEGILISCRTLERSKESNLARPVISWKTTRMKNDNAQR